MAFELSSSMVSGTTYKKKYKKISYISMFVERGKRLDKITIRLEYASVLWIRVRSTL